LPRKNGNRTQITKTNRSEREKSLQHDAEIYTIDKSVVRHPTIMTNRKRMEAIPSLMARRGIAELTNSKLQTTKMFIIKMKADKTNADKKAESFACFFVRFSPAFAMTTLEREMLSTTYKIVYSPPPKRPVKKSGEAMCESEDFGNLKTKKQKRTKSKKGIKTRLIFERNFL